MKSDVLSADQNGNSARYKGLLDTTRFLNDFFFVLLIWFSILYIIWIDNLPTKSPFGSADKTTITVTIIY